MKLTVANSAIGVIGGGDSPDSRIAELAYETGKHIALNGALLVCGGRGGVMEAASRGAAENGGIVVGLLPGERKQDANPYVHVSLPTGMGIGRNVLVVRGADVLIAFPGSYGTLSEMALALNLGKTVIYLPGSWELRKIGAVDSALLKEAFDAAQAVGLALNAL
jgi:uncharacterized protein (TIGR00725 family)